MDSSAPKPEHQYVLQSHNCTFTGRPHLLVVIDPGKPYEQLSTHDWSEWEVIHYPNCPRTYNEYGWEYDVWDYDCWIGQEVRENGLRWLFKYSGTPIDKAGIYLFDFYIEKFVGYEYTEYDGGLVLVDGQIDLSLLENSDFIAEYDLEGIKPIKPND